MNDGIVSIDTVLNDKQFNAQYYEIEDKLNGLVEEYRILSQEEPFEGQEVELKKMATQIQKYNKQLAEMREKTNDVSDGLGGVNKGFKSNLKNLKLFALGLIGLRSAYSLAQRSANAYLSQDTELSERLSSVWFGLGAFLRPLLEWLANAMAKLVGYINVFVKALTGKDFIKQANDRVKAIKEQEKAQKSLNKTTASFDEIDVLSSGKSSSQSEQQSGGGFNTPPLDENVVKKLQGLAQVLKDNKDLIIEVGGLLLSLFVGATAVKILKGIATLIGFGGGLTGGSGLLGIGGILKTIIGFGAIMITFSIGKQIWDDLNNLLFKVSEVSDAAAGVRAEFYANPEENWEGKTNTFHVTKAAIERGEYNAEILRNNIRTSKQLIQAGAQELKKTELTAEQRQAILDVMQEQIDLNREEIQALEDAGYETEEFDKIQAENLATRRQAMIDLGGEYAEQVKKSDEFKQNVQETTTKIFSGLNYLTDTKRVSNDIKDTFNKTKEGAGNIATHVGNILTKLGILKKDTKKTQENVDGIKDSSSKSTGFFETLRQKMFSTKENTKGTYSWLDIINRLKIKDKSFKVNAETETAQEKLKKLMFGWLPEKTKKLLRGWGLTFLAKGGIVHQPGSGVPIGSNIIAGEKDAEAVIPLNDATLGALGEQISRYITANFVVNNYMDNRKINSIQTTAQNRTDIMRNGG